MNVSARRWCWSDENGPAARRHSTAAREAYSLYVERAAESANAADGPLSSLQFSVREGGQQNGLGRRPWREDPRVRHRRSRRARDQVRQRGTAHAALTAAHADSGPGLHLVDMGGALADGVERLAHGHLLAPTERRLLVRQRMDSRTEPVHLIHDRAEPGQVQEAAASAVRLA